MQTTESSMDRPTPASRPLPWSEALLEGCTLPDDHPLQPILRDLRKPIQIAVRALGATHVGDLHGITVGQLMAFPKVGKTGVRSLRDGLAQARPIPVAPAAKQRPEPAPKPIPSVKPGPEPDQRPILDGTEFPDWFLATPLADIPLMLWQARALSDIATVGDLDGKSRSFLKDRGFNGHAARHLLARLHRALARMSTDRGGKVGAPPGEANPPRGAGSGEKTKGRISYDLSTPLVEHVAKNLEVLVGLERDIVSARLGLAGPASTFEAVADRHGTGRADAHRIQALALRRLDSATGCLDAVARRLSAMADTSYIDAADLRLETWTSGLPEHVLRDLAASLAGLHEIDLPWRGSVFAPVTPTVWESHLAALREALVEAGPDAFPQEVFLALSRRVRSGTDDVGMQLVGSLFARCNALSAMCVLGLAREAAHGLLPACGTAVDVDYVHGRMQQAWADAPAMDTVRAWLDEDAARAPNGRFMRRPSRNP